MSTTATEAPGARPIRNVLSGDARVDRMKKRTIEQTRSPRPGPWTDSAEIPRIAATRISTQSDRRPLTFDQRFAMRRSLEDLTALEENRVQRIAEGGLQPLAAYDLGIRYAVHDALTKLTNGNYGDCETCRNPIPVARLETVPYARRCVTCQEREEHRWDQVSRLVGGVVRRFGGEPQGRSEMAS